MQIIKVVGYVTINTVDNGDTPYSITQISFLHLIEQLLIHRSKKSGIKVSKSDTDFQTIPIKSIPISSLYFIWLHEIPSLMWAFMGKLEDRLYCITTNNSDTNRNIISK
jgi:hypothetical protein